MNGQVRGGLMQTGSDMARFPSHWMTSFGVEDADAAIQRCTGSGGAVDVEPWDSAFGRMAVLSDPQGAVFMIGAPQDPGAGTG